MGLTGIDHVQLAMPPGGEDAARSFYGAVPGVPEVPKPDRLALSARPDFVSGGSR